MKLLKRSLIAASTLLLAVGIFTSCSDDDNGDDDFKYLECSMTSEDGLIQKVIGAGCIPDPTSSTMVDDMMECAVDEGLQDELCGDNKLEDCKEYYLTEGCAELLGGGNSSGGDSNPSSSSEGGDGFEYLSCPDFVTTVGACLADMANIMTCLGELDDDKKSELCEDGNVDQTCLMHYQTACMSAAN